MESKKRSLVKSIIWRVLATLNGWAVAYLFVRDVASSLKIAVVGNITGFILYYFHERMWNRIRWGSHRKT